MISQTTRLRLAAPTDLAAFCEIRGDLELQHLLLAWPDTPSELKTAEWLARRASDDSSFFRVITDDNDQCLGFVQLTNFHQKARIAWFGIALVKEARGRGIGRSVLAETLEIARLDFGLRKVCLEVRADNENAISLYKNVGFRKVGVWHDHYYDGNRYHHVVVMERLFLE